MGCNKNTAIITTTPGLGSIDSPYFVQVHIAQRLCSSVCAEQVPIFNPTFSVVSYEAVGAGQYVAIVKVEGIIYYDPCEGNTCATKLQKIDQTFPLAFASTTAPTSVTISAGVAVNAMSVVGCNNHSRDFVSEIPINLTVA